MFVHRHVDFSAVCNLAGFCAVIKGELPPFGARPGLLLDTAIRTQMTDNSGAEGRRSRDLHHKPPKLQRQTERKDEKSGRRWEEYI